jgi:hypothetical protein
MKVFGLGNDFFHIGAEHTHSVGNPKYPNGAQQGIGSFCSPVYQRHLHLWSDDGNDQTWNPGPAAQVDAGCGRLGESIRKCCGVGDDFGKWCATKSPDTLGIAQHLQ